VRLHLYYACLRAAQGAHNDALAILTELYSIARKHLRWSRTLVDKLIWFSLTDEISRAAFSIAHAQNTPKHMLTQLQATFTPLAQAEVSMQWPIIGELLYLRDMFRPNAARNVSLMLAASPLYFNPNITFNCLETMTAEVMTATGSSASITSALPKRAQQRGFQLKNPLGRLIIRSYINAHALAPILAIRDKSKVRSDLLALYLSMRCNKPCVIGNHFGAGTYPTDSATGLPFSPGVDGMAGTADDICLDKPMSVVH
jgi:hypothetical protein